MASSPSAQSAKKSPVPVNIFIAAIFPARWRAQTVARRFLLGRGGGGGTAWNESRRHSKPHAVLHKEHDGARPVSSGLDAAVYCCGTRWTQCYSHHLLWYWRREDGWRPTLWGGGRGSDVVALSLLLVMERTGMCWLVMGEWSFVTLDWSAFGFGMSHPKICTSTGAMKGELDLPQLISLINNHFISWVEICY